MAQMQVPDQMTVVAVHHLYKSYVGKTAVKDLTF